MLVKQRTLPVVARIVDAGPIRSEGDALVAGGGQLILQRFSGLYVQQVDACLIRSALPNGISQQRPIAGDILDYDRCVRIPAQLGRVNQPLVLSCPAMARIDRRLLFAGQPLAEEEAVGARYRCAHGRDVLQSIQIVDYLFANVCLLQIAPRVGVLRVDECPRLGAFGVFEPAVAVGYLRPEVVVCNRNRLDRGRRRQSNPFASVNRLGKARQANSAPKQHSQSKSSPHAVPPEKRIRDSTLGNPVRIDSSERIETNSTLP